jgi:hypothetical protein
MTIDWFVVDSTCLCDSANIPPRCSPIVRAKHSTGVVYFTLCNNPHAIRFLCGERVLAYVLVGPREPTSKQLNNVLELIVVNIQKLNKGVYNPTSLQIHTDASSQELIFVAMDNWHLNSLTLCSSTACSIFWRHAPWKACTAKTPNHSCAMSVPCLSTASSIQTVLIHEVRTPCQVPRFCRIDLLLKSFNTAVRHGTSSIPFDTGMLMPRPLWKYLRDAANGLQCLISWRFGVLAPQI